MSSDGSLGVGDCLAALWAVPGWPVVLAVGAMELRLRQLGQPPGVECLVVRRLHQPLPGLGAKFVCLLLSQPCQRPFGVDVEAQTFGVEVLQRAVLSCGATGQRHVGLSLLRECAVQLAVRPLVGSGCLALVYGDCFGQDERELLPFCSAVCHVLEGSGAPPPSASGLSSNLIQMSSTSPLLWASMYTTVPQGAVHQLVRNVHVASEHDSQAYGHSEQSLESARVFWLGPNNVRGKWRASLHIDVHGRALVELGPGAGYVFLQIALVVFGHCCSCGVQVYGSGCGLSPAFLPDDKILQHRLVSLSPCA